MENTIQGCVVSRAELDENLEEQVFHSPWSNGLLPSYNLMLRRQTFAVFLYSMSVCDVSFSKETDIYIKFI